ncbi:hypothetical protein NFI96_009884 [Prochilodus magdalenae]|nr:hypothetical protein NFI96_009884 [Prochilodus magdalenae]
MIVDSRKLQRGGHSPLTWSLHANKVVRSARQRLFFLRRLMRFGLPPDILTNFYRCTIESIPVWYGSCTAYDRKALKRVVRTAESIIGSKLPDLQDVYQSHPPRTSTGPVVPFVLAWGFVSIAADLCAAMLPVMGPEGAQG